MNKDAILVQSYSSGMSSSHDDPRPDGSSNTFMCAEKYQLEDDTYVLTAIQHRGVDTLQTGSIGGILVAYGDANGDTDTFEFSYHDGGTTGGQSDIRTGTWIMDTTYETGAHLMYQDLFVPTLETGAPVAMETLTIGHEGFGLI